MRRIRRLPRLGRYRPNNQQQRNENSKMARIPYSAGDGGNTYQPLPQGTYDFRINEVVQGTSRNGNQQLQLKMEIIDGPYTGKKVSNWYSLLPQSTWKLDALLEALGIEREDTGQVDANGKPIRVFDDEWLIGRCIQYDVKQREYNGKTNNDFQNERQSSLDPEVGADELEAAPAATDAEQQEAPNTMRRRPRPQRS